MTTATQVATIEVHGRRWFAYGNTYHSARVYVTDTAGNEEVLYVPFQYGYGDQYVQSALEALHEAGILEAVRDRNGMTDPLWRICRDQGIELTTAVRDGLKRDATAWGRPE